MHKRSRVPPPPQKKGKAYRQLWRVLDGAVADAFRMHPEYIAAGKAERDVRRSIVKRAAGAVIGYAAQAKGPAG